MSNANNAKPANNNGLLNITNNGTNINNAARAASAASRAQNDTIVSAYKQRYDDYNKLDDQLVAQYKNDVAKTTAFLQSVKITLNKNSNTNKEIIEQYGILKSFNAGYSDMQKSNLAQQVNVGKTVKGIDALVAEMNATILGTVNNNKKVSNNGIDDLNLLLKKIAKVKDIDVNTYKLYNNLKNTLNTQYNQIYTTLRDQIKNALIAYYTNVINAQIAANTYNTNFNSVGKAPTDSAKVAILTTIKEKLDNLDQIFNTDVAEYMDQIVEPNNKGTKIANSEISAFQNDIQQKINAQSQILNNMIQNIREVTKKDIEELRTAVSDLVTQITDKINAFKEIHSTYFDQSSTDAITKLTEIGVSLNVPFTTSNKAQNNQMSALIRKLAEIATKVGNQNVPVVPVPVVPVVPNQVKSGMPQNMQPINANQLVQNANAPFQGTNAPINLLNSSEKQNLTNKQPLKKGDVVTWASKTSFLKGSVNNIVVNNGVKKIEVSQTDIMPRQGKQEDLVWKSNFSAGNLKITPDKLVNKNGKRFTQNQLNILMGIPNVNNQPTKNNSSSFYEPS